MKTFSYIKPQWCLGMLVLCGSCTMPSVIATPAYKVVQLVPPVMHAEVCIQMGDTADWTCA